MADLDALRASIRTIERPEADRVAVVGTGLAAVDAALPWGGLPVGRVHQVTGGAPFLAPVLAFTAGLAARLGESLDGGVLWVVEAHGPDDALYGPGLAALGLPPSRLVVVRAGDAVGVLWAMEEALRCPAPAAVIGQPRSLTPTAARRLQLAAEQGRTTGFLLPSAAVFGDLASPTLPVATRWRVDPAPSVPACPGSLGPPRWTVTLERCQGGLPHAWLVERNDATGDLRVVAAPADRPAAAGGGEQRRAV